MNDPYSVLGVSQNASDDEIKAAYRALAKKYHPDNYVNNPLADLAQEKMKEINEAYDTITKMRAGGRSNSGGYHGGSGTSSNPTYQQVRNAIASNNLAIAEQLLRNCPNHDAEWHFLMGSLFIRRGWFNEAMKYMSTACSMDPGNAEYRSAYQQLSQMGQNPYQRQAGGLTPCDCCTMYMCADCLCDCI